jgi:hypothetical protein
MTLNIKKKNAFTTAYHIWNGKGVGYGAAD